MPAGALIFLVVLLIFAGLDVFLVVTLFHPGDERGQLIALKAQNILALCVTFSMCAMVVVATVRGDTLYMLLGGVLLLLSAAGKAAAAYLYGKQL